MSMEEDYQAIRTLRLKLKRIVKALRHVEDAFTEELERERSERKKRRRKKRR
jgi:hypothetical protein